MGGGGRAWPKICSYTTILFIAICQGKKNSDSHNHTYHGLVACLYTHDVVEGNPHAVISGGGRGLLVAAFGGMAVQDHQSGERGRGKGRSFISGSSEKRVLKPLNDTICTQLNGCTGSCIID